MRALIVLLALLVPTAAAAEKTVGLWVSGEVLKGPTQDQAEKWLRAQSQKVNTNALPKEAVKTLLDCFVMDDTKCARGIVDARAATDNLITIRVDIVSKKEKDIRVTIDWFVKGRNPVSSRRTCEDCTENVLRTTVDAMLLDLAKSSPGFMGRIKVTSQPPGITVLVDNETIGVTPLERDITAGAHKARLVRDGRMGPEKEVKVEAGAVAEITLDAPPEGGMITDPPPGKKSRALPVAMMIVGGLAIGAGAVQYFVLDEDKDPNKPDWRDWEVPGMITAGAGAAVLITGAVIFFATGSSDGPTVGATTSGDATIGWQGRF